MKLMEDKERGTITIYIVNTQKSNFKKGTFCNNFFNNDTFD